MNEELQSTNEELETINVSCPIPRPTGSGRTPTWSAILTGIGRGVVVLDPDLASSSVWNGQAEELWGLRADEVRPATS